MLIQGVGASEQAKEGIVERAKGLLSKLNWKHVMIGLVPVVLYLYPRPILRLFVPIASKLNRNHPTVACHDFVKEVILTTNPAITRQNLADIDTVRGTPPNWTAYKEEEVAVIELFGKERKGNLFNSQSVVLQQGGEAELELYSEALWTNYRLARLENPQLKAILIKSSEELLKNFLLRFYKMDKGESFKMGFFSESKLAVLRLDERVGTYEHLTCEFAPIRAESSRK